MERWPVPGPAHARVEEVEVKLRPSLLLAPVAVGLSLGVLSPAQAASTDPVTDLTVSVAQAPGSHDSWKVTAGWTGNGASSYSVVIADHDDGSVTDGAYYGSRSSATSPVSITSETLASEETYWVAVHVAGESAPAVGSFHTGTLDTTAPTGTFRVAPAARYLGGADVLSGASGSATFQVTGTALETGSTRKVLAGDGSAARAWASGTSFGLTYTKAGTYTPHVVLSDAFANTRDVALPAVRVLEDHVAPVVRISVPAKATKASSWRVVRGTATDTGTGMAMVAAFVMEKRGHTWWTYDFRTKKWFQGETSRRRSEAKSKATPAVTGAAASGAWRTPRIKGLSKGTLYVQAIAFDNSLNIGAARPLTRKVR
jgi:hypothetical protein